MTTAADPARLERELEQRISELTTLNEVSQAISATFDVAELLDRALRAVVGHLRFDRALVLLADDSRGVLTGGRSVGGTPEMTALIEGFETALDDPFSQVAVLYRADGPMLFRNADLDEHEPNRAFAEALGVSSFLGTPLVTKGRTVGVLAVDNRLTGRDVEPGDGPLLYTLGNLIAAAIETARLYGEIERQNRELEARVAERTVELEEASAAAEEARAAAVQASATKSAFLSNVSHELRTPLTSVVGFTRIIQKRLDEVVFPRVDDADPKVARAMRQVHDNLGIIAAEGNRLTAMINDVLDLAKIEAGRIEWRSEPVSMAAVIDRAAAATTSLFDRPDVALVLEVADGLPVVTGDPDRLLQVVINLLSNAVKFTPAGSVTVAARRGDDGGVLVSVRDTGIGIDPADHDRVFEQFAQSTDTLSDTPRGTGLGLPICRQIVEHHGGRLGLESAVGSGSTFSFSLPPSG